MAITTHMYTRLFEEGYGKVQWMADTIKVAIFDSSYVPARDADKTFSALTGEVSGSGYSAGGQALSGLDWSLNSSTHRVILTADSPVWTASSITGRVAVLYDETLDLLLGYYLSDQDITSDVTDFSVPFDPDGALQFQAA